MCQSKNDRIFIFIRTIKRQLVLIKTELTLHPSNLSWLISKLKSAIVDENFDDEYAMFRWVYNFSKSIPTIEYEHYFDKWMERIEKCIAVNSGYFEYRWRNPMRNKERNE